MDIICRYCGEPIDHDELHNTKYDYKVMSNLFRIYGCGAFDHAWSGSPSPVVCNRFAINQNAAALSGAMQDISPYPEEWSQDFDSLLECSSKELVT